MTTKNHFEVEVPPVTKNEAATLVIHHLQLAVGYYEVTDPGFLRLEAARRFDGSIAWLAVQAWLEQMQAAFDRFSAIP